MRQRVRQISQSTCRTETKSIASQLRMLKSTRVPTVQSGNGQGGTCFSAFLVQCFSSINIICAVLDFLRGWLRPPSSGYWVFRLFVSNFRKHLRPGRRPAPAFAGGGRFAGRLRRWEPLLGDPTSEWAFSTGNTEATKGASDLNMGHQTGNY